MKMVEYLKHMAFWKRNDNVEDALGLGLSEKQKRKYRGQYYWVAFTTFVMSLVYIVSIISLMYLLFEGSIWALAVVILILRDYEMLVKDLRSEVDLIIERIEKRVKKNRKQNMGED